MGQARAIRHVLLYGTLSAAEPAHARLGLRASLTYLGRRELRGTLYDLGPYPGLVLGAGAAPAELYRIDDPGVLERLDRYEGYDPRDPAASLFVRRPVRVARHAQARAGAVDAWVYVFNGAVAGRSVIAGMSWGAYRRRRERSGAAFSGARRRGA